MTIVDSFTLIDSTKLLVCTHTLQNPRVSLEIREISEANGGGEASEPALTAEFLFPGLRPSAVIQNLTLRGDPPPLVDGQNDGTALAYEPNNRIYVIAVLIATGDLVNPFTLVVRLPTLLAHYSDRKPGTILTRNWEEWGPGGSRFFHGLINLGPWVCFVYGEKVISSNNGGEIFLLDFNPLSIRTPRTDSDSSERLGTLPSPDRLPSNKSAVLSQVATAPTIVDDRAVFSRKVQTWLPYLASEPLWLGSMYSHAMIDQEHILILDEASNPRLDS